MRKLTISLFFLLLCAFVLEFSLNVRLSMIEGLSFKNVAIYGLVLLTLVGNAMSGRPIIAPSPVTLPTIAFVAYCGISLLLTGMFKPVAGYSMMQEMLFFKAAIDPYVLLVVLISLLQDEKTVKTLLYMLVGILVVFLLITLLGSFNIISVGRVYINESVGRSRGAFSEWNQYPLYVASFLPLVIALLMRSRSSVGKMFYSIVLLLSGYNMLLTGSRGGLVSLIAGLGAYYLLASRRALGGKIAGVFGVYIALLVLMVALYYLLPQGIADNLLSKITGKFFETHNTATDYSSGRVGLWETSISAFLSSPIFGTGWRTFIPLFGGNSHNDYLLYLVTMGVLGLYMFVFVFVRMFKAALQHRQRNPENRYLYNSFIGGLAAYMTGSFLVNVYTPAYFLFIYAALIVRLGYVAQHVQAAQPVADAQVTNRIFNARSRSLIRGR